MLIDDIINNRKDSAKVDQWQREILKYDQKLIKEGENSTRKARTIEEEEVILNQWSGEKLELDHFYQNLEKFFGPYQDLDYFKKVSPCKIITALRSVVIPDEYFLSFYSIPLKIEEKGATVDKELLVFLSSRDGKNVYYADVLNDVFLSCPKEVRKKMKSEIYYRQEGIAIQLTDIEEHRYDFYNKLRAEVDGFQKEMLAYDQKIIEKENEYSVQRNRTVEEEEDIILNQWGGKKLDTDYFYQHLEDFFGPSNDFEYLKMTSPCKIIFNYTEEIIPEEYFISFYVIPLQEEERKKNDYYKEVVIYVTSRDGKNVYVASLLTSDVIASEDVEKKLQKEVCYYREGIATYYEDMKS